MLILNDITLITIDGVDPESALKALIYSSKDIKFNSIKLLSFREPKGLKNNIEFIKINKLSYLDYAYFKVKKLDDYVFTSHCLIIEPDGFIINPSSWNSKFFAYDYIGAPWPVEKIDIWPYLKDYNRVGNGGFCLRSKKFLEISKKYCPFIYGEAEDMAVCRKYRNIFLEYDIKYAPIDIAIDFSIECKVPEMPQRHAPFGFHGRQYIASSILEKVNI